MPIKPNLGYGLNNPLQIQSPFPIDASRAPSTTDVGYIIGQLWVDRTTRQAYILTDVAGGAANWGLVDAESIATFIVDPGNASAGFNSLQAAVNAAAASGTAAVIYIKEGRISQNIDFSSITAPISICGASRTLSFLNGTHTLHATQPVYWERLTLESNISLFNQATAGSAEINFYNCIFVNTLGSQINLPNWTGKININYCWDKSFNNLGIQNAGAATINIRHSTYGYSSAAMVFTGLAFIENSTITTYLQPTGTLRCFIKNSYINGRLVARSTGDLIVTNSYLSVRDDNGIPIGVNLIDAGAGSNVILNNCVLDTTNPSYAVGAGTVTTISCGSPAGAVNSAVVGTTGVTDTVSIIANGEFFMPTLGNAIHLAEGANAIMGTAALVAGAITVNTTAVAANSRIFLTKQTGASSGSLRITARVAATSFTVASSDAGDTDTFAWVIIQPI